MNIKAQLVLLDILNKNKPANDKVRSNYDRTAPAWLKMELCEYLILIDIL